MKRRDLSAFEGPARQRTPAPRPTKTMSRITLSLPTPVAEALRKASIRRAVGYRALIIEAVASFGAEIREPTPSPPGRTQVPLNLPGDELMAIDRAAHRVEVNRSVFVTECLRRHLVLPPTR